MRDQNNINQKEDHLNRIVLSIINEISRARDKESLSRILGDKIKSFIHFSDSFILRYDPDTATCSPYVHYGGSKRLAGEEFQKHLHIDYAKTGKTNEPPVIVDVETLINSGDDRVAFIHSVGIKELVSIELMDGEELIAIFVLLSDKKNSFKPDDLHLLHAISQSIAVATINIVLNDELAEREREKTILLSLSNEIAAIRNRTDLYNFVRERLKKLFLVNEFVIAHVNEEAKTYSAFILDFDENVKKMENYSRITSASYDISDRLFSTISATEEPVLFKTEELIRENSFPPYVQFWKEAGIKSVLCISLRVGGKIIGSANLHLDENPAFDIKSNLFKSVCSQLAIMMSNIIANEKVDNQLNEIKKYKEQLEEEKIYLKEEIESSLHHAEIIGDSWEMKKVFRLVEQVSSSDSTVLLLGETGTGKELIARAIHNASRRKDKLMVKVNCAALPASLIESELFGHERGSFTGAFERRIGKFELANNGTLFLDEIGEMPLELQVKLLRALQEKEIERVGGKTTIRTDVRIIAATNRDLDKLMQEGKFRIDLYYRLNTFPIDLPPLRNRVEDIPQLASHFILRYSKKAGKNIGALSNKVLQELMQYSWPGNIRELEHVIERSVLIASGDSIKVIQLPQQKNQFRSGEGNVFKIITIDENERDYILKVLRLVKGKISGEGGASELLGLPPSTLNSRMKRLGIRKEHIF